MNLARTANIARTVSRPVHSSVEAGKLVASFKADAHRIEQQIDAHTARSPVTMWNRLNASAVPIAAGLGGLLVLASGAGSTTCDASPYRLSK